MLCTFHNQKCQTPSNAIKFDFEKYFIRKIIYTNSDSFTFLQPLSADCWAETQKCNHYHILSTSFVRLASRLKLLTKQIFRHLAQFVFGSNEFWNQKPKLKSGWKHQEKMWTINAMNLTSAFTSNAHDSLALLFEALSANYDSDCEISTALSDLHDEQCTCLLTDWWTKQETRS